MVALIAPGVCRFAVNATYGGHEVVNIIDMQIDTTGEIEPRASACEAQAGIILNEWDDSMLKIHHPAYSAVSVSWIDLDSLEGSVGVRTSTSEQSWPSPGRSGGNGAPGNVALRVDKNTTGARGQRQGRMFLAGFDEGWTTGSEVNEIDAEVGALINPWLEDFLGDINQNTDPLNVDDYESKMVVTHTKNGLFTSATVVNSLTANNFTSSQVRRIRRR